MSWLGPLIFRIAAWPIDTVEPLRSPGYTAEVDAALALDDAIRASAEELSLELYAVVPALGREQRRTALRVRRTLHRSSAPLPAAEHLELLQFSELSEPAKKRLASDDADRRRLQSMYEGLRGSFAGVLEQERRALYEIASTDEFRKALAVASPAASDAWEESLASGAPTESFRLLATLFNYVMRAAGRATPNRMWAGVAMQAETCSGGEPVTLSPSQRSVFVKPDLNVLYEIFTAATAEPHYRNTVYLRLNPTLTKVSAEEYSYAHCREGRWMLLRIGDRGSMARLATILGEGAPVTFDMLRERTGMDAEELHRLYVSGVLLPECDREGIHENAPSALLSLMASLAPGERGHWQAALAELAAICSAIESQYAELSPEALRRQLHHAREIVGRLAAPYAAHCCPADRNVLVFDATAPFHIGVSAELRGQLEQAVRSYWNFDRGGLGELLAGRARRAMATDTRLDGALAVAGVSIERGMGEASPQSDDMLQRWNSLLARSADAPVCCVEELRPERQCPMGPGAALVAPAITPRGISFRMGSVVPDWGAFYGRFHHIFDACGETAYRRWMREAAHAMEKRGTAIADVAVRGMHERNAALRPRVGSITIDPLVQKPAGLSAVFDPRSGVRLELADGRRILPLLSSAVDTSDADPWSHWLVSLGREAGRSSLLYPQPPLAEELSTWKHCPRLVLDSDPDSTVVIAPERWWCPEPVLNELRSSNGFDRFLAWRAWVRRCGAPEWSCAQYGDAGTESLLAAGSLLAVEVLGRNLSQTGSRLRLQERSLDKEGLWVKDAQGRRYVAEMALGWSGDAEFWKSETAGRLATDAQAAVTACDRGRPERHCEEPADRRVFGEKLLLAQFEHSMKPTPPYDLTQRSREGQV